MSPTVKNDMTFPNRMSIVERRLASLLSGLASTTTPPSSTVWPSLAPTSTVAWSDLSPSFSRLAETGFPDLGSSTEVWYYYVYCTLTVGTSVPAYGRYIGTFLRTWLKVFPFFWYTEKVCDYEKNLLFTLFYMCNCILSFFLYIIVYVLKPFSLKSRYLLHLIFGTINVIL